VPRTGAEKVGGDNFPSPLPRAMSHGAPRIRAPDASASLSNH
jgi:hypothetical protein